MNFLVILAVIFTGGTVFVNGDYYIEFREPMAGASSSSGQPEMFTHLYECKGDPPTINAIQAARSLCTRVFLEMHKARIYVNCNFFIVNRPVLQGHTMYFSDRDGITALESWYLGFSNYAVDHPNFAVPNQLDINFMKVQMMAAGCTTGVPALEQNRLIFFYAQNNLISYFGRQDTAGKVFGAFVSFIKRLTKKYFSIEKATEPEKETFAAAMKMALSKMIDPCSVLQGNLQTSAADHCNEYCHFLNLAALHFQVIWTGGCAPLQGGYCEGAVCTCTKIVTNNPLAGCQNSPMQQCNNSLRSILKL